MYFDEFFTGTTLDCISRWGQISQKKESYKIETDNQRLVLSIDLPGVKKEDVNITYVDKTLSVNATTKGREYSQTFQILPEYDMQTIAAMQENGVLSIKIDKVKQQKVCTVKIAGW